jgi:membrane dipeptidase
MRAGGLTAEFFSIFVDARYYEHPTARAGGGARRALDMIDVTYQQVERHPQDLVLATSAEDIRRAKRDGKIAILMGIEGGYAIEDSLYALRDFYRLGVRYMTLTHSANDDWADSAGMGITPPKPRSHGLSPFGEEVVREMQRIGMLVDVSHASDETVADVLRVTRGPVIASHSASRAIAPHRRNLPDDLARGIAATGGVVMVNFYAAFLDPAYAAHAAAGGTPLSLLVDHIAHLVDVAGEDHVGLGSDFDGVDAMPVGLGGIDGLPAITLELARRGFSDEAIRKVLGENFLRVLEEADVNTLGLAPSNGSP